MLRNPTLTIEKENGTIKVYGNNQFRDLLHFHELTEKEQGEFTDLMDNAEEEYFFRYKGNVVPLGNIMRIDPSAPFYGYGFDGYSPDSFFSGILVKLADTNDPIEDQERVKVYTYIS